MKFSINDSGNLDGEFEMQDIYRGQLIKSRILIKDGYLQNKTLYDSVGYIKAEVKRYYYKDSIKDVEIRNDGKLIHNIKNIKGEQITKEYDKHGKLINKEVYIIAGIEPRP